MALSTFYSTQQHPRPMQHIDAGCMHWIVGGGQTCDARAPVINYDTAIFMT